jgi:hypothetical protein
MAPIGKNAITPPIITPIAPLKIDYKEDKDCVEGAVRKTGEVQTQLNKDDLKSSSNSQERQLY